MKIEGSGSIGQRHGSADPDPNPHQNVMDPKEKKKQTLASVSAITDSHQFCADLDPAFRDEEDSGVKGLVNEYARTDITCRKDSLAAVFRIRIRTF
jgi:hypothetical protein